MNCPPCKQEWGGACSKTTVCKDGAERGKSVSSMESGDPSVHLKQATCLQFPHLQRWCAGPAPVMPTSHPGVPVWILAAALLFQLPTNTPGKARMLGPLPARGKHGWSVRLLRPAWTSLSCCSHQENKLVGSYLPHLHLLPQAPCHSALK